MDNDLTNNVDSTASMNSRDYEKLLQAEYNRNQAIVYMKIPLTARSFLIPAVGSTPERQIEMTDSDNQDKQALYMMIVAAYNYAFFDKFAAVTAKERISSSAHLFIEWLNQHKIKNRYEVLKEYEHHRFDVLDSHGGYSAILKLRTILTYSLDYSTELLAELPNVQLEYLQQLRKTKISPNVNKKQISIASYFGALDWLRREDVGIGNELYTLFTSAKLSINSLIITASTVILELHSYKKELKRFLENNDVDRLSLPFPKSANKYHKRIFIGKIVQQLIAAHHRNSDNNETLRCAITLILLSTTRSKESYLSLSEALESEEQFNAACSNGNFKYNGKLFSTESSGHLFGFETLQTLAQERYELPISNIESLMFSWLMAALTVQPSDIAKLMNKDFRKMKVGQRVTHIECEYFKGRAKVFHTTRAVSTRTLEGKAIQVFLSQCRSEELIKPIETLSLFDGHRSLAGCLIGVFESSPVSEVISKNHQQSDLPALIPSALVKLIQNGVHCQNLSVPKVTPIEERKKLVNASDTPCQQAFLSLMAIKNSAVHAFSDPYTLDYLVNRNSHTNQTERQNYLSLNGDNEEYLNACGRITREVMFDLIHNVFDLRFDGMSEKERTDAVASFNSEFMAVTEDIEYRKEEMLSRLKVVTNQNQGEIKEVGVLAHDHSSASFFEPIYVLDSPITAWKMMNYLHEFNTHYRKLLDRNPDYLYKTAIPTAEWTEAALSMLSKNSYAEGEARFKKMLDNNVEVSVFHSL